MFDRSREIHKQFFWGGGGGGGGFLDLWSTNIEARYDICRLPMPELV